MRVLTTAIVHPAAILRGAYSDRPAQIIYLRRALAMTGPDYQLPCMPPDMPPGSNPEPTVPEIQDYLARAPGSWHAVDLEAAGGHITMIGIRDIATREAIIIWLRRCGGELAWPDHTLRHKILPPLYDFFADPTVGKVYQNGAAYDIVAQLERVGFDHQGYMFDTMLAAAMAFPEMSKDLEHLAVLYAGMPGWKYLSRVDPEGEDK